MPAPRALIFDVDGTLADTEAVHRSAFNEAFAAHGLPFQWDLPLYTRLLSVAGGKERLAAYWRELADRDGAPAPPQGTTTSELLDRVHATKTERFASLASQGKVLLRPGVARIMQEAQEAGLLLGIATTTTRSNVDAVVGPTLGANWRSMFAVVADGESAARKKPDPEVYLCVLRELGLPGAACLAFEDSSNGLRAARAAGIPTFVTPTAFTRGEDFAGAIRVLPDLGAFSLDDLVAMAAST